MGNLDEKIEINSNDEIGIVYKHFNDMTEKLKTSTDKIEQMHLEELQRLNRLKTLGELTSQTAHEVNNHIAIIMARADYLNLESKNIPELAKYNEDLQVLIDQTTKISEITGNILKYSRKKATELKEIDLIKTIDEFVTVYTPLLLKKNIKLITNCNLRKATIVGDSIQINQILTNLVMNAVDAIGNKGKIEFEIVENGTGKISLIINDDGPGISTNNLNEIFTPFFTTKSSQNNTGLGLYIVKKICENHSAEIRCESDRKRGTSFIISFNKIKKS
ncbi:MAG: ATP-binding protein [Ignavibacteriaceae bacterium]